MIVFSPSNPDIVKNYFLSEGDKGIVSKVRVREIESLPLNELNYITQVEVGPYNMNKKFPPGLYNFIYVQFSKHILHLFISPVNPDDPASGNFFLYKEVEVKFNCADGFEVW